MGSKIVKGRSEERDWTRKIWSAVIGRYIEWFQVLFPPLRDGRGDESADTNMSAVARFCPLPSAVGRPVLFKAILNVLQTMGSATERRFLHTTSQSPTIQIPRSIQTPRSQPRSHTTIANCQLNDKYNIFHPGQTVIDLVSALVHGFVCLVNMCRASHRDRGPR